MFIHKTQEHKHMREIKVQQDMDVFQEYEHAGRTRLGWEGAGVLLTLVESL